MLTHFRLGIPGNHAQTIPYPSGGLDAFPLPRKAPARKPPIDP